MLNLLHFLALEASKEEHVLLPPHAGYDKSMACLH
jgi:hypothetical protein